MADRRTGLPVYSLHGKTRKPTKAMLNGLDALVIDLQDIGVRSYTFSSAMLYAMEACFQYNVEVIVLDRPNPLGGLKVGGPPMDPAFMSYVGAFRVPYVHGLTMGELARLAAAKGIRLPVTVTETELRALVAQLFSTRTPLTSPAGRPTYIELNHGELARRFQK